MSLCMYKIKWLFLLISVETSKTVRMILTALNILSVNFPLCIRIEMNIKNEIITYKIHLTKFGEWPKTNFLMFLLQICFILCLLLLTLHWPILNFTTKKQRTLKILPRVQIKAAHHTRPMLQESACVRPFIR